MEILEEESLTEKYAKMYQNNQLAFEFVKESNSSSYDQIVNALGGKNFNIVVGDKTFSNFNNLSHSDYTALLNYLVNLLIQTEDSDKIDKIKKLIAELYGKQVQANRNNNTTEELTFAKTERDLPKQKAIDYSEYAVQQLSGFSDVPEITIDVSSFEHLTDEKLFEYYNADKFYKLSKQEQQALLQTSVNRYLDASGVSRIPVVLDRKMALNDRFVEYGNYKPNHKTIYLNDNLFNNIDQNDGNAFLPLKLLSTVIHEARHHVQFSKFNSNPTNNVEQLIQKSMQQSQASLSFKEYLSQADELDARNAALEYMRNAATKTQNINFAAFYNSEKRNEQLNKKSPSSEVMMNACQDIYDNQIKFDINSYYISRIKEQQTLMLQNAQGLYNYAQRIKKPY